MGHYSLFGALALGRRPFHQAINTEPGVFYAFQSSLSSF